MASVGEYVGKPTLQHIIVPLYEPIRLGVVVFDRELPDPNGPRR